MGSQTSTEYSASHMSQLRVPKYDLNSLAVVTVIFNPIKYKSRYELYHKFDEHMSRSGVTLLTIECIFDCPESLGLPLQKFEITREKDPRHLQVRAPSVLWLKENLINIAVKRLPDYIEYVAWLDADIEFQVGSPSNKAKRESFFCLFKYYFSPEKFSFADENSLSFSKRSTELICSSSSSSIRFLRPELICFRYSGKIITIEENNHLTHKQRVIFLFLFSV